MGSPNVLSVNENKKNLEFRLRYSFEEDMAIVNYITTDKRYLRASGIQVWKDAEEMKICPGRPYLSLKERYRKVIVKNLKKYNIDSELALKITQFSRATSKGKRTVRNKQSGGSSEA